MTFTYSGDPTTSTRNKVRFLLNDTLSTDPLFTDEELDYLITEWGTDVYEICRAAAETLSSKFTRLADQTTKSVGDLSLTVSYRTKAKEFQDLATSFLNRRMRKSPPAPWASADNLNNSVDRVVDNYNTEFWVGQFDNPNNILDKRVVE
jgi:hypothetical protein